MGAQFTSQTTNSWYEDTETVTIVRATPSVTPGTFTLATIYSGACDFQEERGSQFINPSGKIDQSDAILLIDPTAGALPSVNPGDKATINGTDFGVMLVQTWSTAPIHLELQLKRGPMPYKGHA